MYRQRLFLKVSTGEKDCKQNLKTGILCGLMGESKGK